MSGAKLTGEELQRVKQDVLREQESYLCEEIGDPGRYFASLRSKGILSQGDCDVIRKQHTPDQMVGEFVRILITQRGRNDVSSFDVFVEALKNQRVQAHIARSLMKTYAKRKAEREQQKGWSSSAVIVGFSRNCAYSSNLCFPPTATPVAGQTNGITHQSPKGEYLACTCSPSDGMLTSPQRHTLQCRPHRPQSPKRSHPAGHSMICTQSLVPCPLLPHRKHGALLQCYPVIGSTPRMAFSLCLPPPPPPPPSLRVGAHSQSCVKLV